jgi:hypothetical protein
MLGDARTPAPFNIQLQMQPINLVTSRAGGYGGHLQSVDWGARTPPPGDLKRF